MASAPVTDYRLATPMVARLVGLAVVLLAVLVLAGTAVVAATGGGLDVLVVLAGAGLLAVLALAWWLRRLAVVRFDDAGYRVRMVRGAGVRQAGWKQVREATTASPRGVPCVILKLVDGGTTTIPVEVLAVDREQFVRQLQQRLREAEGLRPL